MMRVSTTVGAADVAGFCDGLRQLREKWYRREGGELKLRQSFTLVMLDKLGLSQATGVWPERDVIKYIRSSMAIDGLIRRFAPELDLGVYLAQVCERHLRWQAFCSRVSPRHLLVWSTANARLLFDGALRTAELIERLAEDRLVDDRLAVGRPPQPGAGDATGRAVTVPARAVILGFVVLALTLSIVSRDAADFGVNLFTAQLLLVSAGLWKLLSTVRLLA